MRWCKPDQREHHRSRKDTKHQRVGIGKAIYQPPARHAQMQYQKESEQARESPGMPLTGVNMPQGDNLFENNDA